MREMWRYKIGDRQRFLCATSSFEICLKIELCCSMQGLSGWCVVLVCYAGEY
jgi:hypothetical protein